MENLYVFGNGLDLHFGMETNYNKFLEHLKTSQDEKVRNNFFTQYFLVVGNLQGWCDFEAELAKLLRFFDEMGKLAKSNKLKPGGYRDSQNPSFLLLIF